MDLKNNMVADTEQQENFIKPIFELDKSDKIFALCAVLVSIFTSVFGFFGGFAFGYFLSIIIMLALFIFYFSKNKKLSVSSILYGFLSLSNSVVFICTSNGSVRFFAVIISLLLSLVCYSTILSGTAKGNKDTFGIFYFALSSLGKISISVRSVLTNQNGDKKSVGKVFVGLICAVPVLAVVIPLLISSDDAFEGMISNIVDNTFSTFLKAIFGLIVSLFVISYGFSLKYDRISKVKSGNMVGIENIYLISFLSAIGACYALYLFSQLAYFFSAFKGFLPDGEITYAQYARKGFFEMCFIAVINLLIVFIVMLISKKNNGNICNGIKILGTFFGVFTLIIISTAISKMVLYISVYGMTVLRLTTSAFMLFLAVVFVSVVLKIYIRKINIIKTALITAGSIVLLLGAANVNAVCAEYNYKSFENKTLETIDVNALYNLGDEGIPTLIKLTVCEDEMISKEASKFVAKAYLFDYFENMEFSESFTVEDLKENQKFKGFENFSLPRATAYNQLYKFIENNPNFSGMCRDLLFESEENLYY